MKVNLGVLGVLGLVFVLSGMTVPDPDPTPVADAAMQGDTEQVRQLLANAADVNEAQGDGMTALHWAAMTGNPELAQLLIDAGANLELTTRLGSYRPLHLASKEGNAEVLRILLEAGAKPDARTTTGDATALHLAAAAGDGEAVSALVDFGADPDARESEWGQTPLIFAASWNRVEAITALLERGADPSLATQVHHVPELAEWHGLAREAAGDVLTAHREAEGGDAGTWRPTFWQAEEAAQAARRVLRSAREELEIEVDEEEPGTTNHNEMVGFWGGLTPLLHAVREGHLEAVEALLAGGADIDQPSAGDGTTPLLMAAINGQFDVALRLIEHGASPDLASDAGTTPLYAVLERQWTPRSRYSQVREHEYQIASHLDVLEALLEAGADPNVRLGKHLWYMIHSGCGNFNCGLEVVWGATPFWRAAYGLDVDAMRLLLAYGADPNIPTRRPQPRGRSPYGDDGDDGDHSGLPPIEVGGDGVFPIHAASGVGYGTGFGGNSHRYAATGFLHAIRFLVEEVGVDVNARDFNGFTPLHHAAARGDDESVLYLVEQGADVTAVGRSGQTTVDLANGPVQRVSPYLSTVRLLESLGAKNNNNCVSC